jgi:hypothetical protein
MQMSSQFYAPAALPPVEKSLLPIWWKRLDGLQRPSVRAAEDKIFPPLPEIESRSSSPQPNHYTAWATPALRYQ